MSRFAVCCVLAAVGILFLSCTSSPSSEPIMPARAALSQTSPETSPKTSLEAPGEEPELRRLTLRISDSGVVVLASVAAPGALNRRDPHADSDTFFRVVTGDNQVLFSRGFAMPGQRRAEFAGENGAIERVQGPDEEKVISIVVPVRSGAAKLQLLKKRQGAQGAGSGSSLGVVGEDVEMIGEVSL